MGWEKLMTRSRPQFSQEIEDMIRKIVQREHTTVEAIYDPTRVYEYGAQVQVGVWDIPSTNTIMRMRDWCSATYGAKPYGEYYGDRWMVSNNTFWFKHERDRMLFLMMWANPNNDNS